MKKQIGYYKEKYNEEYSKPQESVATETKKAKEKIVKGKVCNCVCVIVRTEGRSDAANKDLINAGTDLTIFLNESTDDFYKVTYGDGKDGFVHKSLVERR